MTPSPDAERPVPTLECPCCGDDGAVSVDGYFTDGQALKKGDPLFTTIGAGGGALLSEALQAGSNASARKSYDAGYEKGRSDAAKQQYQALNERQRISPQSDDAPDVRLLEVPLPEREENGVILAPSTATLRVHE